jgi:hypothetical protein
MQRPPRASKAAAGAKIKDEIEKEKKQQQRGKRNVEEEDPEEEQEEQKKEQKKEQQPKPTKPKSTSFLQSIQSIQSTTTTTFSFELTKLPKPCLQAIFSYLDGNSLISVLCTSKQFQWMPKDRQICAKVFFRHLQRKYIQQPNLDSEWCHESLLGGWLSDVYFPIIEVFYFIFYFYFIFHLYLFYFLCYC